MFTAADHTFVVCAYGESPYLAECVQSLKSQTVATAIIMATSTPNDVIRGVAQDAGITLFVNDAKPGIASDWNFAVSRATTPLVTIAHQDDTYAPRYAQRCLAGANKAARPLIFFTNYGELRNGVEVDDNQLLRVKRMLLKSIAKTGLASTTRAKRSLLSKGSAICCPSVTLCTPNLPNPPFNAGMKSNLDWDAWERFSHLEGDFVYDTEVLMHHRIHEESETSALIKDNTRTAEDLAMLERFWPKPVARLLNAVYSKGQNSNQS